MEKSPFRKDLLSGKVALVTGGGTGINFTIAKAFIEHGGKVAIIGRRQQVLEEACNILGRSNSISIQGDVRSWESAQKAVAETVKKFGRLDILINGAAGNFLCAAEDLSPNAFKTVIDIDLVGTFNMCKAAFEELKKTKGTILNISATLHYHSTPWQLHASAAKAGVDSITLSLANEWGEFGIRVNGIAPGPIKDTTGFSKLTKGPPPEEIERIISQAIPIGRIGTKEDVALAALFLVSDASSYVTGDTLIVDGGSWLWKHKMISREALHEIQKQRKQESKL